ncbi:MAG: hypothetical protein KF691_07445 [Phycisphaeraceae bacterium]|nr:hypothetical protein [Phycisphaeraceae bacterium]
MTATKKKPATAPQLAQSPAPEPTNVPSAGTTAAAAGGSIATGRKELEAILNKLGKAPRDLVVMAHEWLQDSKKPINDRAMMLVEDLRKFRRVQDSLRKEQKSHKPSADAAKVEDLKMEVQRLEQNATTLRGSIQGAEEAIGRAEDQVREASEDVESAKRDMSVVLAKLDLKTETAVLAMKRQLETLEAEADTVRSRVSQHERVRVALSAATEKLELAQSSESSAKERLGLSIEKDRANIAAIEGEISGLRARLSELGGTIEQGAAIESLLASTGDRMAALTMPLPAR